MPLREFTDEEGVSWRVWDVHPKLGVFRKTGSGWRRTRDVPELILERRQQRSPQSKPGGGWLVFDSEEEKRRLSPVLLPTGGSCPVDRLMEYWERAEPAPKRPAPGD